MAHETGPSGHANRPATDLHSGMSNNSPSAKEPHPSGPSVDVPDLPSPGYIPTVNVPGPRSA